MDSDPQPCKINQRFRYTTLDKKCPQDKHPTDLSGLAAGEEAPALRRENDRVLLLHTHPLNILLTETLQYVHGHRKRGTTSSVPDPDPIGSVFRSLLDPDPDMYI